MPLPAAEGEPSVIAGFGEDLPHALRAGGVAAGAGQPRGHDGAGRAVQLPAAPRRVLHRRHVEARGGGRAGAVRDEGDGDEVGLGQQPRRHCLPAPRPQHGAARKQIG